MMQQLLTSLGAGVSGDQATFIGKTWTYTSGPTQVNASASGPGVSSGTDAFNSHNPWYTSQNTLFNWTCPTGVTQVSILCVGGGGGGQGGGIQEIEVLDDSWDVFYPACGGGGGSLIYLNHLSVTPGTVYKVVVGAAGWGGARENNGEGDVGGNGGNSFFSTAVTAASSNTPYTPSGSYIQAGGGQGGQTSAGGSGGSATSSGTGYTGATGRGGGDGGTAAASSTQSESQNIPGTGGGAAGYSGDGGDGCRSNNTTGGSVPSGGGGGGGGGRDKIGSGGGGVGMYGEGASGNSSLQGVSSTGWPSPYTAVLTGSQIGQGGSSGEDAQLRYYNVTWNNTNAGSFNQLWDGGKYGGGGSGNTMNSSSQWGSSGAPGVVRILWADEANYRYYPNTNTTDM